MDAQAKIERPDINLDAKKELRIEKSVSGEKVNSAMEKSMKQNEKLWGFER